MRTLAEILIMCAIVALLVCAFLAACGCTWRSPQLHITQVYYAGGTNAPPTNTWIQIHDNLIEYGGSPPNIHYKGVPK